MHAPFRRNMHQEARRETKFRKLLPRIVDNQPTSHRGVSARLRGPYGPLLMLKYRMPKQQQEVKGAGQGRQGQTETERSRRWTDLHRGQSAHFQVLALPSS